MEVKRFIPTLGLKLNNGTLISALDNRIKYVSDGSVIVLDDKHDYEIVYYHQFIECYFDLERKKLLEGFILDYYPNLKDLPFKKGDTVLYEKYKRHFEERIIKDILFKSYNTEIRLGEEIYENIKKEIKENISDNIIYEIKIWKASYLLDDNKTVVEDYMLGKKI